MHDCYRQGLAWLARSGIQAESGGVSRYYAGDSGAYKDISTEITGYAIQAYLQLPLPGHTGLLSNALRAGQFLCYDAADRDTGLFPYQVGRRGAPASPECYFFDCGIIIRALMALWSITSDPMYLERAETCGAAMAQRMSRVDGAFFPFLDLGSRTPQAGSGSWSVEPDVYQLKTGLAFLELAEVTSSGMFAHTADQLIGWSLRRQEAFLPGDYDGARVADRLHAYCYFLEGLLPFIERRYECAQALQSGMRRVEALQEETRDQLERCDVIAQLLRLRLLADYMGISEIDLSTASREAESLPAFQLHSSDRHLSGAFSFGRRAGQLVEHANPVATIFCLQALRMWQDYQNGELRTTWRELI